MKLTKDFVENFKNEKKKQGSKDKTTKYITIVGALFLILIIIILQIITANTKKQLKQNDVIPEYAKNFNRERFNVVKDEVKEQPEIRRFKIYLGDILDLIEKGEYDEVYARLDDTYKKRYFPNIKVFSDYCKGEFPKSIGYVIKNFERIGDFHIYTVDIGSELELRKKENMKFVFKEDNFNDYRFSFSKY